MKKRAFLFVAAVALCGLGACTQQAPSKGSVSEAQQIKDKSQQKDFTLKGIDGKTYKLSDFKGKKVYLKFWASWCSICLASLADTDQLAATSSDDQVVLSVVSPGQRGEKSEADFKKWYQGLDYKHLPVLLDPDGSLLDQFGVKAYPTQVFFDKQGRLAKTQVGFMDKETIQETLKELK